MKLGAIADALGGQVLQGNSELEITGVGGIETAGPTEISFYESAKYREQALESKAGALLVRELLEGFDRAQIQVEHPYVQFLQVVREFHPEVRPEPGVHASAVVHETAVLADDVSVGPHAVVEAGARIGARSVIGAGSYVGRDTTLGDDCLLYPRVVIREACEIGNRVILHPGVVIGSDGFGYVRIPDKHVKIPHVGRVRIEDDVEIGSNSAVDRGTFGWTVIEQGTKIDNLVQVGHNVRIGARSILCGQAGVSGSSTIGNDCILAGQAGVADHVTVGNNAILGAKAGVHGRVKEGTAVSGYPAVESRSWVKQSAALNRLPDLIKKVRALEKKVRDLEGED